MRVLIIGAHGRTGRLLTDHLTRETDHQPVAMIRDPAQAAEFDQTGVTTVVADLGEPFEHAFADCDAVIFAAGSGGSTGKHQTVLIDHLAAIASAVHAHRLGVLRFIMLSAVNARPDAETPITHYHRAKGHADRFLLEHEALLDGDPLQWTTLHPGKLDGGGEAVRGVELREGVATGQGYQTSRQNTAAALAACLDHPATIGRQITVLDGPSPVAEAFAAL